MSTRGVPSRVQAFVDCQDLAASLLPVVAQLQRLRSLDIDDCHLFASDDARDMAQVTHLEHLRLSNYAWLGEGGMAQARAAPAMGQVTLWLAVR